MPKTLYDSLTFCWNISWTCHIKSTTIAGAKPEPFSGKLARVGLAGAEAATAQWRRGRSHLEGRRRTGGDAVAELAFGHHQDRTSTHGYEPTREAAMAAFAKSWRRE
jgi:hypothetical protein